MKERDWSNERRALRRIERGNRVGREMREIANGGDEGSRLKKRTERDRRKGRIDRGGEIRLQR